MPDAILILRTPSGLSGDMFLTGLAVLQDCLGPELKGIVDLVGMAALEGCLEIVPQSLEHIAGFTARVNLPHSHEHRRLGEVQKIVADSHLSEKAKGYAAKTFEILAEAEGLVHGVAPSQVSFHEVGALDSLLDVCLVCELFARLAPASFVCSPLPVCDGEVRCRHGLLATPTPAVLHLLQGVPVYGVESRGETVTPTAIALLKALDARFGTWPSLTLSRQCRVYGSRVLPNIPNGAIFALGAPN